MFWKKASTEVALGVSPSTSSPSTSSIKCRNSGSISFRIWSKSFWFMNCAPILLSYCCPRLNSQQFVEQFLSQCAWFITFDCDVLLNLGKNMGSNSPLCNLSHLPKCPDVSFGSFFVKYLCKSFSAGHP